MNETPIAPMTETHPCLYCSGVAHRPLYSGVRDRLGHVPGEREYRKCLTCGSATLHPFPDRSELVGFYPPVYSFSTELGQQSRFKRFLASLEGRFFFQLQYEAQVKHVLKGIGWRRQQGLRLLDVGCGRGLRLLVFKRHGFDVRGVDFQPDVVEYVRDKLGIPATVGDTDSLSSAFAGESFDVITAFHLLEHVVDVRQVLASCFQLLRPGGWFVAAIPIIDGIHSRILKSRWIGVTEAPRHLSLASFAGIERLCREVGYHEISFRPDSVLNCSGMVGSSLFPGASLTDVYGGGKKYWALFLRLLGGGATLMSIPLCLIENYVLRLPSLGMVFARKPLAKG